MIPPTMVRTKMVAITSPGMWQKLGLSRPIHILTDSDKEAINNPPPITEDTDTGSTEEMTTRATAIPVVHTYCRRAKASMMVPLTAT